jgi:quercetin dioxygenase-like cupin family protein
MRRVTIEIVKTENVPEIYVNERTLQWIVSGEGKILSKYCSCCIVQFQKGASAKPPHSHPDCEELIYVLCGSGEIVLEGGKTQAVEQGAFLLFRRNEIHLLRNTGEGLMKVICFYSSPTNVEKYIYYPMESVECPPVER